MECVLVTYQKSRAGSHTVDERSGESLHWNGGDHRFLEWADEDCGWSPGGGG